MNIAHDNTIARKELDADPAELAHRRRLDDQKLAELHADELGTQTRVDTVDLELELRAEIDGEAMANIESLEKLVDALTAHAACIRLRQLKLGFYYG